MGKWAPSEFDRVLVEKIKQLYNSFEPTPLAGAEPDTRFATFVRNLNPDDRGIQACFHSLIQQQSYNHHRPQETRIQDAAGPSGADVPLSYEEPSQDGQVEFVDTDDDEFAGWVMPPDGPDTEGPLSEYEGPVTNRRAVLSDSSFPPHQFINLRQQFAPNSSFADVPLGSPDPLLIDNPVDIYLRSSSHLSALTSTPPHNRRRSASPSYSPSRARTIRLAEGLHPSDADPPGVSSPQSPSRAWLEEYNRSHPQPSSSGFAPDPFLYGFPIYRPEPLETATTDRLGPHSERPRRLVSRRRRYEEILDEDERVMAALRDNGSRRRRQDALPATRSRRHRQGGEARDTRRDGIVFDDPLAPLESPWATQQYDGQTGAPAFVEYPLTLPHRRHTMPPNDRRPQSRATPLDHDEGGPRPSSAHISTGREHVDDVVDPSLDAYHYIR